MWTLELAVKLVKKLEPELSNSGYHCALTGSVLYKGSSEKDLDIVIYPHDVDKQSIWDRTSIKDFLKTFFKSEIKTCGGASQIRDDKHVAWLITPDGRRIDFFFLR